MKMKSKKARIVLVVLLALLVAAVIVGPALAGLVWRHELDHRTVIVDYPDGGFNAISEGFTGWEGFGGSITNQVWLTCSGSESPRARLFTRSGSILDITYGCVRLAPTPAPTMDPYDDPPYPFEGGAGYPAP